MELASQGTLRSHLANAFKPGEWAWPTFYLFPDMQGTILEDVLPYSGTIGIGPYGNMDVWHYIGIVGQLSQPIGTRILIFLGKAQDYSQPNILAGLKYILWDPNVPLSPGLTLRATSVTPAAGFLIISLPYPPCIIYLLWLAFRRIHHLSHELCREVKKYHGHSASILPTLIVFPALTVTSHSLFVEGFITTREWINVQIMNI